MKKYRTTIWPLALVWSVLFVLIVFFSYQGAKETGKNLELLGITGMAFLYIGSIMLIALVSFGWLTYEEITSDKHLKHVVFALFRRKVDVQSITRITQEGTYYVLQNTIKSIYIYYTNTKGQERFLHISMALYGTSTLQKLLKEFLAINPNIKLDQKSEKLLKTGKT